MKNPGRIHTFELPFGKADVFFPEASDERCEAVLVLDVDPVALVRGRGNGDGLLSQYVNDRPYAASSFLSVALNRAFRTAVSGASRERQELADTAIPLEIVITPLPVRGDERIVHDLFEPLGWKVCATRIEGPDGPSRYVELRLRGEARIADAFTHLYVLVPALDANKHYWIGEAEVDKLIEKGGDWLAAHPSRELVVTRYLKRHRQLARLALARLAPDEEEIEDKRASSLPAGEEQLEGPIRLHDLRLDTVAQALALSGAKIVADLGCGEGKLLRRLVRDRLFEKVIGLDASVRSLEIAAERLRLSQPDGPPEGRIVLLHGALTYRDARWHEADAAALVEVIEHLDPDRLPAMEAVVFGAAKPKTVIVTTPNRDYNVLFESLPAGNFRHPDHRFEWSRDEFVAWASSVCARYGYQFVPSGIGEDHPEFGAPSQMAVFTR